MTAEMLTLALDISTVRREESGRCDSGLCPFHLFRSVRQPFFFAGCSGDLLVVAHFQCRLRPVGRDARSPFHRGDV